MMHMITHAHYTYITNKLNNIIANCFPPYNVAFINS